MQPFSNLATVVVFTAILLAVLGGLGFLAVALLPGPFLGILLLIVGMPVVFGLHYVTWGWMMSQLKDDEDL